ncbi:MULTISPECIES: hypothetical protein [unclassified Peribacillus]|uniref:hypothetical protein n=1 Tax=unclassified Peribacillus TaxID=2675266 RepID=UPI001F4E028A|nr:MULTISPECIES: hypothetical protein [unclassified Peribacillus]MCK1985992.1 hypothetical protein [Peribacillus sp. Aquil_B1]MCK2011215.1 hypothetical protein [Peribacillus sp. Aquil_B8]
MIDFIIFDDKVNKLELDYRSIGCMITNKNNLYTIVEYPGSTNKVIISSIGLEELRKLHNISNEHFVIKNLNQTIYFNINEKSPNLINSKFRNVVDNELIRKDEYINSFGYNHQIIERKIISNQDLYQIYVESYDRVKNLLNLNYEVNIHTREYIAEWLNHLLEFEMNSISSMKTCIAENGKKLKLNIHDADVWKEKLEYSKMSIPLSIKLFLTMREYNSHFLEIDKFNNHYFAGDKKVYLRDIILNVTSHTLEHITDLENKLEELT